MRYTNSHFTYLLTNYSYKKFSLRPKAKPHYIGDILTDGQTTDTSSHRRLQHSCSASKKWHSAHSGY